MTLSPLRIGLAGLGTVGTGVITLLRNHPECREKCRVTAVSARNATKDRGVDLSDVAWVNNPVDLADRDDVDVVVEVMGGEGDPALSLIRAALNAGKPVITANKALLAHHGIALAALAEKSTTALRYEAAVAGGIPIIKMVREGFAANTISALAGILNGTCNYILTTMDQTGRGFDTVLPEAQALGYAEADPTLDVDGGDTGHKLCLLTALAFGCVPDYTHLSVEGIRKVSIADIRMARAWGYRIKLVAQARRLPDGRILQMVAPTLVAEALPLAQVDGVLNAVAMEADPVGRSFVSGRGAGAGPTASAVVADILDEISGRYVLPFSKPVADLSVAPKAGFPDLVGRFYVRVTGHSPAEMPEIKERLISALQTAGIALDHILVTEEPSACEVMGLTAETSGAAVLAAMAVFPDKIVMPVMGL